LHPGNTTEHRHRTVQHPHGAFHFGGEINVPGGIDDINAVGDAGVGLEEAILFLRPIAGRGGRGDRDSPLPLLFHPIRDGIAVIHVAHPVDEPRVVKNALSGGRLPGIDVRGDPDVTGIPQRIRPVRRIHCFRLFHYGFHPNPINHRRREAPRSQTSSGRLAESQSLPTEMREGFV
jgi:hypothetical protein